MSTIAPAVETANAAPDRRRALSLARLSAPRPRRRAAGYAVAIVGTVVLTASLLPVRDQITPLSKGFGFLAVVVVAAAVGGLGPGLVASVVGFITFNFFFLPPYNTFVIARGEDVVVLFVFLGLSILISTLLARASERALVAEAHEAELRTLQSFSADLVAMVPGPGSYQGILARILDLFGFSAAALFVQDPVSRELREQVAVGVPPGELAVNGHPGSGGRAPERLPLSVGGRTLGLLVLRTERPPLSSAESRVLRAVCDEFALTLERDRLLRVATDAEVYRQSDRVRRSLLAAVSHDLRTPIASIKASVTDLLAQDEDPGGAYTKESLRIVDQETDRLAALIANLLDMSRIEAGMLHARIESVDLAEILSACQERACRQWPDLRFRTSVAGDASGVRADPVFLDRVVSNLVDNAVKAGREAGVPLIDIEATRDEGTVIVRIIDHGKGVPPTVREQLFYAFYQLSERHPRLGTGLGLAISKGFLDLMRGGIWIEDTPGGGATLAFSLPSSP